MGIEWEVEQDQMMTQQEYENIMEIVEIEWKKHPSTGKQWEKDGNRIWDREIELGDSPTRFPNT